MLPREAELVSEWTGLSGFRRGKVSSALSGPTDWIIFSADHVWSLATIAWLTSCFQRLRSSAARTHCDVVNCVHCLMLSMYCFRGLLRLRLPSTYSSTTVLVIWQPWSLQRCPKYESLRLRTSPSNSCFMSSSCRILLSVLFSIQLICFILRKATFGLDTVLYKYIPLPF